MKHFLLSFLSLTFLSFAALAVLGGWGVHSYLKPGPLAEDKLVIIKRGMGAAQIAGMLAQEGVISSENIFKLATRFTGSLKAGEYQFPKEISMAEAISIMENGQVFGRKITIAEGLTSHQIVSRLMAREDLSGMIEHVPPEGSLLPDTYHFVQGEARADKIAQMRAAMTQAIEELWPQRAEGLPIKTKQEAIILASIIEKETAAADERERVAGVFINRLKKGMLLQTDPTVIYAITKGKIKEEGRGPLGRRLLRKDLQIDSPYNTYKYVGLPPGPIANPGYASIKAALNPQAHDYIFFVADGTGGHAFAKTLKEHNRNVAKWRKLRD